MPKMKRKSRSQRNLENKLHKRRQRHLAKLALLSKHAKQTTEIGTQIQIFDTNEMVTSSDHTNNQPTPIHSNDNSQNEYQPTLIYSNDTSQSEYKPTLIYSNVNSRCEYQPTLIHSNDYSQSEYQPTPINSNDNSQNEYKPTLIYSNDTSQIEYKPTLIYSNVNSRCEYQPTLIHSNNYSQSEYQPTLIYSNDDSQIEHQPTLIHSNDNSRSEYQPTLIHSNDISQSEYQPTLIHNNDNSQSEYKPTLIHSNDNSQSESSQTHIYVYGDEPLTCGICCKGFNQMRLLRVHMRTHNEDQPHKCDICSKEFKGKKEFQIHMKTHTGEQPYKCDICSKGFIGETKLQLHMRTHTGENLYKCDICCKAFGCRTSLRRHRNKHHGHLQSQIELSDQKVAALKNKLREFFRKSIGKKPDESGEVNTMANVRNVFADGQDPTGTKTANEQNKYIVNDKSFSQDKQSLLPKRKETSDNLPFTCEICGKGFKGEIRLQVHMRTHTGETPYKCDICFKGFTQRCTLANHMKIHAVHCKVCDFANCQCHLQKYSPKGEFAASKNILGKFLVKQTEIKPDKHSVNSTMDNVSNHLSNDQEPKRTETCGICCKEFKGKKVFLIHMRTHTGEQPYKCDICSKGFIGETKLQLHMRTHTGEKPYKCDICCKAFGRRTSLTRHRNIHHVHHGHLQSQIPKRDIRINAASKNKLREYFRKNTGKKPDKSGVDMYFRNVVDNGQDPTGTKTSNEQNICVVNDKSFSLDKQSLLPKRKETSDNLPFTCKICDKGFKGEIRLQVHMRTHTGETPYKCDICSKGFIGETKLQLHMRTHTGENLYKCDICCKAFGCRTSLTRHRNKHHGHLQSQIELSDQKVAALKNKLREFFRKSIGKKPDESGEVNTMANVRNVFANGQDPTGTKTANEQNKYIVNDKSFSQDKQSLLNKRKETSDNLPFTCEICGKGFKGEIRLQVHMRTHTGETPYKCDICFKGFTQRCTLANHMKIHAVHCKVCDFANCQCHLQKYSPKGEFAASKNILRKFLVKQTEIKPDKHSVNNTMANVSNHLSNDQEPKRTETCGICCKEFKGKKVFLIHMRTHTGEQPYKCDICSKGFIGETKLQLHMRTHTGEKPYKCDICCKAFGRRTSLTRHRNIHHVHHGHLQSQIPKRDIRINAASKNKLREYFRKNTGKKPDKSGVDMYFRNVVDNGQDPTGTKTSNEQNICVVNDKSFSLDKQSLLPKRKETSDNLPFTCKICDKGFKGEIRLQVHMRTHTGETPYKCDICFKGFTQRCTLANHMKIHAVHCKVCHFANCRCHLQKYSPKGEFAASKNILRKFLVKQTEIKPDKHSVNSTMDNVSNHLSNDQEPKRTETCGICCKEFQGKKVFLIHMRTHTGEQPYKCDICFKGFIGETKLQLHMRTHTGEKPYKCDICCKAFGRRTSLTRHRNIHHGHLQSQIPKRDIRINAASKNKLQEYFRKNNGKTPDKSGVDMHFRNVVDNGQDPTGTKTSNEQNICVVNDKSFSLDKQSLLHVLPKRKETSDNLPFTCKICDKGFKGKLRLQVHMRTHTGETPYKCDICFKGFTHRCTLANHMKIHADHCNVCDFANCRCHLQKYSPKTEFAASKNILRKFLVKQTEIKPDKHGVNNTMANVSNHLSNDQEPTRTETENEQFICGVCGEIFSGDSILVLHMKKHACDITNTMANDRNDISNDHDHTISNTDQDNHDHTISYNDQHHHDNHDHDDHTNFNTDQEFTISYNEQDHHDHTISTTDQDYTILNTDQEFTISYNDQDHHDHPISNTDQDHTILNTDQVFIISKNDQHLQDHTILKTDQEFTISKNDQHHHDHPISNTDQDHTILNTDQEFTISKNDQHHHDHTISNIKIEQFLCGVCRKSFSEENKLRLHTKITHKSLLSVIT